MSTRRLGLATTAAAFVMLVAACGNQTPPPSPSGAALPSAPPDAVTSLAPPDLVTSPGPSEVANPPIVEVSSGSDFLAPDPQPAFPGLYLPAGFVSQASDHFALIQAPFDCPTLTDVLAAGEWTVADEASIPLPTAAPGHTLAPMPDLNPPKWLLLRWGEQAAVARVGGDETGCLAQVWRVADAEYTAHGAIESTGSAQGLQVKCAVGAGVAEFATLYFGGDGTFYTVDTSVPLKVGIHPLNPDTELSAGVARDATIERAFLALYTGDQGQADIAGIGPFHPVEPTVTAWPGTIEVTGIEPLTGEMTFEDIANENGEEMTLTTTFRCDLRPGQRTRAAEQAANATPSPTPSPSAQPGQITVVVASGPHAGTYEVESGDAQCALNGLGGGWLVTYSDYEPVAGELQAITLTLPKAGGKTDVTMYFGDDFDRDWFLTNDAATAVTDSGASVNFAVTGSANGTDFSIDYTCFDVLRF